MRLNYGRYLLSGGSLTVMEIANITGFADTAHFSREFRKAFGDAPSAFRASERTNEHQLVAETVGRRANASGSDRETAWSARVLDCRRNHRA
ncbi:helix-turn-helix domain-containing protein [Ensifer adhaerens]|uniref:helix-turn-helix domain-containing protein n=1 Tax=Ensifer adhaerens TaxID=106592 RepID=UPI000DE42EEC